MRRGLACLGLACLVVVGAVATGVMATPRVISATLASPRWAIQGFPRPTLPNGDFTGVACPGKSECLAVGFAGVPGTLTIPDDAPLAASWDGSSWKLLPTVSARGATTSSFAAVACWSTTGCMAVGRYEKGLAPSSGLAELWNGTRFSVEAVPSLGWKALHLTSVSCVSASSCVAVGYAAVSSGTATAAESWNGNRWVPMKTPDKTKEFNDLTSVSCAGARCLAVGYYESGSTELPISASLSGTSWTLGAPVSPAGDRASLSGVACYSSTGCVAVGTYTDNESLVLTDSWNGSTWSSTTPSVGGWFQSVTCAGPASCLAAGVGDSGLQAMSWNGASWGPSPVVQPTAPDKTQSSFDGVACSSPSVCLLVGVSASQPDNSMVTLAETLRGATWRLTSSPDVPGPVHIEWSSDSCVGSTTCFAVGQYWYDEGDSFVVYYPTYHGLAEEWNGKTWTVLSSSALGMQQYGSNGGWQISCLSSTSCIVTGSPEPLHWNGSTFTAMPVGSGSRSPRFRVFCVSSSDCYSSGSYLAQSIYPAPYIDHWNGTDWSTEYPPIPTDILGAALSGGISCRSATSCIGIGTYSVDSGSYGFVETLSGSQWLLSTLPYPTNAYNMNMNGVSCTASACMAMASSDDAQETFALRWIGTSWTVETTPLPSVDSGGNLLGVSCPSESFCISVGFGTNRETLENGPLTETWDGAKWTIDPVVYPTPHPYLGTISCTAPGACTAVGAQIERYVP